MYSEIDDILWKFTVSEVKKHAKKLKVKTTGTKMDIINNIMEFYNQDNWVINNYNAMNEIEKEYMNCIIMQKFSPTKESLTELDLKYKDQLIDLVRVDYYYIDKKIPRCFKNILKNLVPLYEMEFKEVEEMVDLDKHYGFINGESKQIDYIDNYITYINSNNIKPTEKRHLFPKQALKNYLENCDYQEISRNIGSLVESDHDDATTITFGIKSLLKAGNVIFDYTDGYDLSYKYNEYTCLNKVDKARYLLESYLKANTYQIDEVKRIIEKSYDFSHQLNYYEARKYLLDVVKLLPVDKWISGKEFIKNIRMRDFDFVRKHTGIIYREYNRYFDSWWDSCEFYEFENYFINVCLMEYFAVLGIIDVVVDVERDKYDLENYLDVSYLKLTDFGAVVLGLKDNDLDEEYAQLFVNENFEITITNGIKRLEHEIYFGNFFEKIFYSKEKSIFKLDFIGFQKAYQEGITVNDVLCYLIINTEDIPLNVLEKLDYYSNIQDKVKIKTVTILEYPSEFIEKIDNGINKSLFNNKRKNYKIIKDNKTNNVICSLEDLELFYKIEGNNKK